MPWSRLASILWDKGEVTLSRNHARQAEFTGEALVGDGQWQMFHQYIPVPFWQTCGDTYLYMRGYMGKYARLPLNAGDVYALQPRRCGSALE